MWSINICSQLCFKGSNVAVSSIYGGESAAALIVGVMEVSVRFFAIILGVEPTLGPKMAPC